MTIGSAPSANTTVTLSYGGTATQGIDFDVTTNQSFLGPSNVINFANGDATAKEFIVRVYDDADPEPGETLIVNFAVNNGGGNAVKGTTFPVLQLDLSDNEKAPTGYFNGTIQVGTLVGGQASAPFDARVQRQRGQFLYKASELSAAGISAGEINSMALFISSKVSTRPFSNFTIKVGHSMLNNLVDGSIYVAGGLATVYSSASYSTVNGWNTFNFSSPFTYDGTSSLAVEICYDNAAADAANFSDVVQCYADGSSASQGNMFFQNGIGCSQGFGSVNYFNNGVKPAAVFGVEIDGTLIESTLNAQTIIHVGEGSDDYFYSNPDNKLFASVQNVSANLGCVTAKLEGAGVGWVAYAGGQRSAKLFAITPSQNGLTADYTLSLYFNNTELNGKIPSSLKIAKTSATSVALANGSNTVLVNPVVTAMGTNATVFTASFTGFSRFFLVDDAVALPIELTDFTAKQTNDKNILLEWNTSYERNNHRFEIEWSNDGSNFQQLAQVLSKGDADQGNSYNYLHERPLNGPNYYRLRQIDIDSSIFYSKVVSVSISGAAGLKPWLAPNPVKEFTKVYFGRPVTTPVSLEILSSDLRSVHKEVIGVGAVNHTLTIGKLPAGVYFIRMIVAGKTEILRFVKE
jgi:hypothetical protein